MMELFELLAGREVHLPDEEWTSVLAVADRTLSTPLLKNAPGLPLRVREEVESRIAKIARRRLRVGEIYQDVERALVRCGVSFVVLKGITHERGFGLDPALRVQNDIDVWVRDPGAARRALVDAGFVPHRGEELSQNHGSPLLKPHTWQWEGDYFDPDMPVPVEIHHTLWNERYERIAAPGIESFWPRRAQEGDVPALSRSDRLGFAALHILRHVLHNHVRPGQAWELARMMEAADETLWCTWSAEHPKPLRKLQAVAFLLAATWFGGRLPAPVEAENSGLSPAIRAWFGRYAGSPLRNLVRPNKDAVRLHMALIDSPWDRLEIARRRLLPFRLPRRQEAVGRSYGSYLWSRLRHHAETLIGMGTNDSSVRHSSD